MVPKEGYLQLKPTANLVRTFPFPLKLALGHNCTDFVSWPFISWAAVSGIEGLPKLRLKLPLNPRNPQLPTTHLFGQILPIGHKEKPPLKWDTPRQLRGSGKLQLAGGWAIVAISRIYRSSWYNNPGQEQ